jgi:hypothetical protein
MAASSAPPPMPRALHKGSERPRGGAARAPQLRVVRLEMGSRGEDFRRRHGTRAHGCRPSLTPPSLPPTRPPACPCLYAGRAAPCSCAIPALAPANFSTRLARIGKARGKGREKGWRVARACRREAADPPSARELPSSANPRPQTQSCLHRSARCSTGAVLSVLGALKASGMRAAAAAAP